MPSSGSTWLYNVTREILSIAEVDYVAFRAEGYENFIDTRAFACVNAVLRGHSIESLLLRVLSLTDTKMVLSFRDPRDAIASFLQRFGSYGIKFPRAFSDVCRSLAALVSASDITRQISFFYEDDFTKNYESVRRLGDFLGYSMEEKQIHSILDKYSADAVRAFIADIDMLPDDRLFIDKMQNAMDRVTSFHRTHISDMRVGKWRNSFDLEAQSALAEVFGGYLQLLENKTIGVGRQPEHNSSIKSLDSFAIVFSSRLFSPLDDLDFPTRFLTCGELNGILGIKCLEFVYIPNGTWNVVVKALNLNECTIRICQNGEIVSELDMTSGEVTLKFENKLHDHPLDFHMVYGNMSADIETNAAPPKLIVVVTLLKSN